MKAEELFSRTDRHSQVLDMTPALAEDLLTHCNTHNRTLLDTHVEALAGEFYQYTDFLFLGRGINYPVALEGALKLKEISYIHAEGYPAGEMKHGPIALIDENMPVVCLAPKDAVYDKMISQIEQAKARNAIVIAVATDGDEAIKRKADHVIYVPPAPSLLMPVLLSIPMQLLAYYIAVRRGCDVQRPWNGLLDRGRDPRRVGRAHAALPHGSGARSGRAVGDPCARTHRRAGAAAGAGAG